MYVLKYVFMCVCYVSVKRAYYESIGGNMHCFYYYVYILGNANREIPNQFAYLLTSCLIYSR